MACYVHIIDAEILQNHVTKGYKVKYDMQDTEGNVFYAFQYFQDVKQVNDEVYISKREVMENKLNAKTKIGKEIAFK